MSISVVILVIDFLKTAYNIDEKMLFQHKHMLDQAFSGIYNDDSLPTQSQLVACINMIDSKFFDIFNKTSSQHVKANIYACLFKRGMVARDI